MTNRPRVAILVESSRGYGRGLLHGIAEYVRVHGPWSVYFEERDLGDPPPDWLAGWRGQGVIARIETRALAQAVAVGGLQLGASADVPATIAALKALPGIGDWTAQYIAMRALRWPDAFPAGDVALHKALDVQNQKHPARAAEEKSQAWRPWRSYAVLRAWSSMPLRSSTAAPSITRAPASRRRATTRRPAP